MILEKEKVIVENKFKYIEKGEGETILLLHGLFGSEENFSKLIEYFSRDYKVVFPFLPLYDISLIEANVSGMVKYVSEFIEFKNLRNINIVGNSLGGHIAQLYSIDNIENVKSLILTGSSGLFENSLGNGYPNRGSKVFLKEKIAQTFFNPIFATDKLVDEIHEIVNNRGKAIRVILIAKSAIRQNLRAKLNKLTIPVKLIWGADDIITPLIVADEFHELLPISSLDIIDKCGHAAMMERPFEFNQLMKAFLIQANISKN